MTLRLRDGGCPWPSATKLEAAYPFWSRAGRGAAGRPTRDAAEQSIIVPPGTIGRPAGVGAAARDERSRRHPVPRLTRAAHVTV